MKLPLHWLLPRVEGIPVLMYHRVSAFGSDRLSITVRNLRDQFSFLSDNGYTTLSLSHFLDAVTGKAFLPEKTCLLTFDDGYASHYEFVYPLLMEYHFHAVFFIVGNTLEDSFVNGKDPSDQKMSIDHLKSLDPAIVQLALHSYDHVSFARSSSAQIKHDLYMNSLAVAKSGCPFYKVLAYPNGARPRSAARFRRLKRWMYQQEIEAAFRIGNKPCVLNHPDPYDLRRIDISGTDSIRDFSIKLRKGKLKPF